MLRRKLLVILGSLVAFMVAMAMVAILLLQGVLRDLDHINTKAAALVDRANTLNELVSQVEVELYQLRLGQARHLDPLVEAVDRLMDCSEELSKHYAVSRPEIQPLYHQFLENLPDFKRHVSAMATAQDKDFAAYHNREAIACAMVLRTDILQIGKLAKEHANTEQLELSGRFRMLVVGMSLGFLMVINLAIVVLLRIASMILKPVEQLVEASRQLAAEHFDYRVQLQRDDEFDQLARAYNQLAEQLQAHEKRRLEMIGQVGLTLNHELNNAIAIIELQLNLMEKRTEGNAPLEKCLRQIHENLDRMTKTVEMLKQVRRIVLTDYVPGQKMLDLQQSSSVDPMPAQTNPPQRKPA